MTAESIKYISVQDAANEIQVTDQFLWKLIRQNRFPAKFIRLGAIIRIEKASWNAFLESGSSFTPTKRGRPRKAAPEINMDAIRSMSM